MIYETWRMRYVDLQMQFDNKKHPDMSKHIHLYLYNHTRLKYAHTRSVDLFLYMHV